MDEGFREAIDRDDADMFESLSVGVPDSGMEEYYVKALESDSINIVQRMYYEHGYTFNKDDIIKNITRENFKISDWAISEGIVAINLKDIKPFFIAGYLDYTRRIDKKTVDLGDDYILQSYFPKVDCVEGMIDAPELADARALLFNSGVINSTFEEEIDMFNIRSRIASHLIGDGNYYVWLVNMAPGG